MTMTLLYIPSVPLNSICSSVELHIARSLCKSAPRRHNSGWLLSRRPSSLVMILKAYSVILLLLLAEHCNATQQSLADAFNKSVYPCNDLYRHVCAEEDAMEETMNEKNDGLLLGITKVLNRKRTYAFNRILKNASWMTPLQREGILDYLNQINIVIGVEKKYRHLTLLQEMMDVYDEEFRKTKWSFPMDSDSSIVLSPEIDTTMATTTTLTPGSYFITTKGHLTVLTVLLVAGAAAVFAGFLSCMYYALNKKTNHVEWRQSKGYRSQAPVIGLAVLAFMHLWSDYKSINDNDFDAGSLGLKAGLILWECTALFYCVIKFKTLKYLVDLARRLWNCSWRESTENAVDEEAGEDSEEVPVASQDFYLHDITIKHASLTESGISTFPRCNEGDHEHTLCFKTTVYGERNADGWFTSCGMDRTTFIDKWDAAVKNLPQAPVSCILEKIEAACNKEDMSGIRICIKALPLCFCNQKAPVPLSSSN
uniref:CUB domain-containing protein n=1 Tax=Steinernema glaseri TaxID=37863 RepID=A0A1I8AB22_9BILA